jgi:hypothetical protein
MTLSVVLFNNIVRMCSESIICCFLPCVSACQVFSGTADISFPIMVAQYFRFTVCLRAVSHNFYFIFIQGSCIYSPEAASGD